MGWMNTLPALKSSIDTSIILNSMYDISYGIYNRNNTSSPLAKVLSHPSEKILPDGRFELSLKKYMESDVLAQTGITFTEAIKYPTYRFEEICRLASEAAKKKSEVTENAINRVAKSSGLPKV